MAMWIFLHNPKKVSISEGMRPLLTDFFSQFFKIPVNISLEEPYGVGVGVGSVKILEQFGYRKIGFIAQPDGPETAWKMSITVPLKYDCDQIFQDVKAKAERPSSSVTQADPAEDLPAAPLSAGQRVKEICAEIQERLDALSGQRVSSEDLEGLQERLHLLLSSG